jgi:Uma2 family endonuclease
MSTAVMIPPVEMEPVLPDLYEVVDGEIKEKLMSARSTDVASVITQVLGGEIRSRQLGKICVEMLYRIDVTSNLQRRPDVSFVSSAKWPWNRPAPEVAAWDMIPDLAIEVISPTNKMEEVMDKMDEYFRAGVSKVWIVLPVQQRIFIFESVTKVRVLTRADTFEDATLFPGLSLPLTSLFESDSP